MLVLLSKLYTMYVYYDLYLKAKRTNKWDKERKFFFRFPLYTATTSRIMSWAAISVLGQVYVARVCTYEHVWTTKTKALLLLPRRG